MKECTIRANKRKIIDRILVCGIILLVWKLLSCFFPPIVVPEISGVCKKIVEILTTKELYSMIGITGIRLMSGLLLGLGIGGFLGICMGKCERVHNIVHPIIGIMQTVPPVSWLVLALIWFGFNGRPAVFIIAITTIPVIAIHMEEGIISINRNLLEMAEIFDFSGKKVFRHIVLPSMFPYVRTAIRIALGSGWKIAVMGEVLTTTDGIGGMIKQARLNIEPETVIAWSVMIVVLFYISDFVVNKLFFAKEGIWNG